MNVGFSGLDLWTLKADIDSNLMIYSARRKGLSIEVSGESESFSGSGYSARKA